MLSKEHYEIYKGHALHLLGRASIVLTADECERLEVADYGFGFESLSTMGLELVVYENNDRYCAKEMVCLPGQISPEHIHPPVGNDPGKRETFRCRWGTAYLYVTGEPTPNPYITQNMLPPGHQAFFTVWHQITLRPGQQYTLEPGVKHWFTGGPEGAVISEFSSHSHDECDIFTDPNIKRIPEIVAKG